MATTITTKRVRRPRANGAPLHTGASRDLSTQDTFLAATVVDPKRPATPRHTPRRTQGAGAGSSGQSGVLTTKRVSRPVRRRQTQGRTKPSALHKFLWATVPGVIGALIVATWLSGLTIKQSFAIQDLVAQESQLTNEVETLNRDYHTASSTAEVSRKAADMGMVVPSQPGILQVDGNGTVTQTREGTSEAFALLDVNGQTPAGEAASSDPRETHDVGNQLSPVPQGEQRPVAPAATDGLAPYTQAR